MYYWAIEIINRCVYNIFFFTFVSWFRNCTRNSEDGTAPSSGLEQWRRRQARIFCGRDGTGFISLPAGISPLTPRLFLLSRGQFGELRSAQPDMVCCAGVTRAHILL